MIPATHKAKAEIARNLRISRRHIYDVLREHEPASPAVAVRLGKLIGDGAGMQVGMRAAHDTWNAGREVDVSRFPRVPAGAALSEAYRKVARPRGIEPLFSP